jgi:hypothetical protein
MKKLMMVAAILALTLVVAVPAIAAQSDGLGNGNNGNGFGNLLGLGNGNNGNGFNNDNGFGNGGVTQDPTQTFVSGSNTNTGGAVDSRGNNSNTCAAQENFNNSGGVLNQPSIQQYASQSGGILSLGPSFLNNPQQTVPCEQTVQQAASSSSGL